MRGLVQCLPPTIDRSRWITLLLVCLPIVLCLLLPATARSSGSDHVLANHFKRMPVSFVENQGQWDADIRYVARTKSLLAFLQQDAITLRGEHRDDAGLEIGIAMRMTFEGASESVVLSGKEEQSGTHTYLVGNDPARWKSGVPGHGRVVYQGLYEGVDLWVRETSGSLEYDVVLAPGADLDQVVIRCDGAAQLELNPDGSVTMRTEHAAITQSPPRTWYELPDGGRRPVECRFRMIDRHRFGFEVPERDPDLTLVIDPVLEWSTFIGGAGIDGVVNVSQDLAGNVIVVGGTRSADFPETLGETQLGPNLDWFVAALTADGSRLLWSTRIGGSGPDVAYDVGVDDAGRIVVVGNVASYDFPVSSVAADSNFDGLCDGAVVCLSPDGAEVEYSTFVGGSGCDWISRLAVAGAGQAFLFGHTESVDMPVTAGAFDPEYGDGGYDGEFGDVFVACLDPSGRDFDYLSYVGGRFSECEPYTPPGGYPLSMFDQWLTQDIALHEPTGEVVLIGVMSGPDYYTTEGAYDTTYNGGATDGFVTRVNADGTDLVYSTFLGGSEWDFAYVVKLDERGRAIVGGSTRSPDFPTTEGAYSSAMTTRDHDEAFLTVIDEFGATLTYSTFIGGSSYEDISSLVLDDAGDLICGVFTRSDDFPTTPGAYDETHNGGTDVAILKLRPGGNGLEDLIYSTYIGGQGYDGLYAMERDRASSSVFAVGISEANYPVTRGAYDTAFGGVYDGFVTRLDGDLMDRNTKRSAADPAIMISAVSPNPTAGLLRYRIDLEQAAQVQIHVFDIGGRRVATLMDERLPAGDHAISMQMDRDFPTLANGTYFLSVQAAGERWTREFVVVR